MAQVESPWPCSDGEMAGRIRAFDWATTRLGPIVAWSERLKLMVEQVLAYPLVSSLVCGPELVLIYNDAAATLYGGRHPAALGRPLPEAFLEGWASVAPFYARAFAGETVQVAGQPLDTRGEGEATDVFDAVLTPAREADGRVAFVHMTGLEIGARMRAEAALRESEERHRLLIGSWAQAVWETDADGVVVADSPSWRAYTGQTLKEWLGYGWLDAIHPDDRAYAERQWREAMAVRRVVDAEFRLRAPGGGWRWTNVRAAPVLNAEGGIEKWAGVNIDIDARKRAEAALQENEERQTFLLELSDALRGLADPIAIEEQATRLLAEQLNVSRAVYATFVVEGGREYVVIEREHRAPGTPSLVGRHPAEASADDIVSLRAGRATVIPDIETEPMSEERRAGWRALGVRARMGVPLIKRGRLAMVLGVQDSAPRAWTLENVALVREVGERTWAAIGRARAEAALRKSEQKYRTLFETMGQGFIELEVVRDQNGRPIDLQYLKLNPAFERQFGVPVAQARGRRASEFFPNFDPV